MKSLAQDAQRVRSGSECVVSLATTAGTVAPGPLHERDVRSNSCIHLLATRRSSPISIMAMRVV
jgi:hypothetical protein